MEGFIAALKKVASYVRPVIFVHIYHKLRTKNSLAKTKLIVVTGSFGKTIASSLIHSTLKDNKVPASLANSVLYSVGLTSEINDSNENISSIKELYDFAQSSVEGGDDYLIVEISHEMLASGILETVKPEISMLTNIDASDIKHESSIQHIETYQRLQKNSKLFVTNSDDSWFNEFKESTQPVKSFGTSQSDTLQITSVKMSAINSLIDINIKGNNYRYKTSICAKENCYNSAGAILVACEILDIENTLKSVSEIESIPGRVELMQSNGKPRVILDSAYRLKSILAILHFAKQTTNNKLIVVFGGKGIVEDEELRSIGEAIALNTDTVIITGDEEYFGNQVSLNNQIIAGIDKTQYVKKVLEPNRKLAIETALAIAKRHDTILVLGLGQKKYRQIQSAQKPHSDKAEILKNL